MIFLQEDVSKHITNIEIFHEMQIHIHYSSNIFMQIGWETSARPLANASENLAGRVENKPGRVEFCIGYIRDYPVRLSAKIF